MFHFYLTYVLIIVSSQKKICCRCNRWKKYFIYFFITMLCS